MTLGVVKQSHNQAKRLMVVTPWYVGIAFRRYYQGLAERTNLPHVDHHRGYHELKEMVMSLPTPAGIENGFFVVRTIYRLFLVNPCENSSVFAVGRAMQQTSFELGLRQEQDPR